MPSIGCIDSGVFYYLRGRCHHWLAFFYTCLHWVTGFFTYNFYLFIPSSLVTFLLETTRNSLNTRSILKTRSVIVVDAICRPSPLRNSKLCWMKITSKSVSSGLINKITSYVRVHRRSISIRFSSHFFCKIITEYQFNEKWMKCVKFLSQTLTFGWWLLSLESITMRQAGRR